MRKPRTKKPAKGTGVLGARASWPLSRREVVVGAVGGVAGEAGRRAFDMAGGLIGTAVNYLTRPSGITITPVAASAVAASASVVVGLAAVSVSAYGTVEASKPAVECVPKPVRTPEIRSTGETQQPGVLGP